MFGSKKSDRMLGNKSKNPFEIDITAGEMGCYGDYNSGLPIYDVDELKPYYSCVRGFAKMAIENRFCNYCRFPWVGRYSKDGCTCHQFEKNKESVRYACSAGMEILDYHREYISKWANEIEKELEGDSEYACLNRKAREVMGNRLARYNAENYPINSGKLSSVKNRFSNIISKVKRWFNPLYWAWYFKTPKSKKVKSIPLFVATPEEIKSKSSGGNCYLRTKGGSVVVVPSGILDKIKKQYPGSEIVEPLIKY